MANRFYQPGVQRADRVRELFSAIAHRYDLLNDLQSLGLHRRWKRRLVRCLACPPGGRALDLCCGTGDVSRALAENGACVVGLDFSAPMLQVAADRLALPTRAGAGSVNSVRLVQGDALCLPFADDCFDAITISYGLRNLADLGGGLREMSRVARPGGRLGILDFGAPSNTLWRPVYFTYLRLGVPLLGRWFCGDAEAYRYILESLRHFPSPQAIATELERAGWINPVATRLLGGAMTMICARKPGPSCTARAPADICPLTSDLRPPPSVIRPPPSDLRHPPLDTPSRAVNPAS